ncbi:hypothetical protein OPQ81_007222 [Rhizoctonia solani]|nr:hypothetical protein OPQ81_007222 [Rhizoctonia solani]
MVVTVGQALVADTSMEESLLADLSNVSQDESQRIDTQTRAAVYWAGNKEVTSQQVKELYHIAHSPPPQQNPHPSPPSSSPATGSRPHDKGPSDPDGDVDSNRTASCRKRNPTTRPISVPIPQSEPHGSTHKRTMTDDAGDYWYRTSADVLRALGPQASSTPSRSQSRSQSQSQSQKQTAPKLPIQSPPASPPRASGTGLVQQFSQLSTSEASQERTTVLVPGSSGESNNQPGTTQIVDYPSERSIRPDTPNHQLDLTTSHKLIPSNELFFQRSLSPPFHAHQRPPSPIPSPSLGGSPRRMFTYMNRGGGSSPPASSAMPTQDPDLNSQTMDMDIGLDETEGGSLDTQGTTPTQLDPSQLKYISATPVISDDALKAEQFQETPSTQLDASDAGNSSGTQPTQIATQPTQIVTQPTQICTQPTQLATQLSDDTGMYAAEPERVSRTSPPPITPIRTQEPSRTVLDNTATSHLVSPRRALTTPPSHPNSNPYRLDRSRKSSFAPPVRSRPDAQRPLPPLNIGPGPLRSTQSRWDAKRAEDEEREARLVRATVVQPPPRTPSPRRRKLPLTEIGNGIQDVLTKPTGFVRAQARAGSLRLDEPSFSPGKMAVDDPEEEEEDPSTEPEDDNPGSPKPDVSITRRDSSLPLEAGRKARQEAREREKDIQERSGDEYGSGDEATPQRATKPNRGMPSTRRTRGRGRGRVRGTITTPRTPHEAQPESSSPVRTTSAGKKRAMVDTPREKSPAPAKKPKVRPASGSTTPVTSGLVGTRVLAWWHAGNYFFGTVVSPEVKGRCEIEFDDGTSSKVPLTRIRRATLRIGDDLKVTEANGSVVDATVVDVSNWETKHKVRVSITEGGEEVRKMVESRVISITTKTVGKSWGDRMLDEKLPVPSIKRKGTVAQAGTTSRAGSKLSGYAFVLTLKAEDVGVSEKELDGWKTRLRAKIEGQSGVVVDEWEELFAVRGKVDANGWYAEEMALQYVGGNSWPDVRKVFLLSGKMGTTPKYLMALALGVPCLSYKWVDEFLQDDTSQWMDALLPRGTSDFYQTEISQIVDSQLQSATDMVKTLLESKVTRKPFKGNSVLCIFKRAKKIQPEGIDKGKFYSRVACVMGASTVHLVPDNDLNSLTLPRPILDYDYVVCENAATLQNIKSTIGAVGRSTDWVKQCIIMGRVVPSFNSEQ